MEYFLFCNQEVGLETLCLLQCVIAYNEENAIDRILSDIAAQDYNHNDMEVVLVDGASTDNTKTS